MIKKSFGEIIARNFDEICKNFKIGLAKIGYPYDEDLMQDAFISCYKALNKKLVSKQEAIKYYWTAYINKYKTSISKQLKTVSYDDVDMNLYNTEEEEYDKNVDTAYDIIIHELCEKYGVEKIKIWESHITKNKEAESKLTKGCKIYNFANITKQIKRYIHKHILKSNKELSKIIVDKKDL